MAGQHYSVLSFETKHAHESCIQVSYAIGSRSCEALEISVTAENTTKVGYSHEIYDGKHVVSMVEIVTNLLGAQGMGLSGGHLQSPFLTCG